MKDVARVKHKEILAERPPTENTNTSTTTECIVFIFAALDSPCCSAGTGTKIIVNFQYFNFDIFGTPSKAKLFLLANTTSATRGMGIS